MSSSGILHAYKIEADGTGIPLTGQAISDTIKDNALAWVHLDAAVPETRTWLEQELTYLDQIILDALLAEETRPRIVEYEEGALLILRGVNLNKDSKPEDMISIRLWIDAHRIISVRLRPLKAIIDIKERLEAGKGPKNAGDFIVALSSRLFERMEPVFSALDENLDIIEEQILEDPNPSERSAITAIRKQAIMFRRYIAPQREVIMHLRTSEQPWLDVMHKRRLQEVLDHVIRYVEDLDSMRERAQIVKDELSNVLADRMNKNMYVLSVIAAIFLRGCLVLMLAGFPVRITHLLLLFFALCL